MGRKLRGLVGALKDTASLSKAAAALSPSSAAQIAVLRATPHHPADEPPHPRHIHALLSFGHGSRLSAASVAGALASRLRSTRDPAVTSLLNQDLIFEMEVIAGVIEEMSRAPEVAIVEGSRIVGDVVRLVEADRAAAEREILIRVLEMRERRNSLGFADSVELVCVLRRVEQCRYRPWNRKTTDGYWLWAAVGELAERVEEVVLRKEEEEKRMVRREKAGESARIAGRVAMGSTRPVRFGSMRWAAEQDPLQKYF